MGGEGSGNELMLLVEVKLDTSLWGAHEVCKEGMAKSYIRGPEVEIVLSASISILF